MDTNFNSVFDDSISKEEVFDTIFTAEEDDDLIGFVLGESGDEEVDMNTIDDDETVKDLKDDLDNGESEKPPIDSNGSFDIEDDSKTPGENIACDKYGVEDAVETKTIDAEDLDSEMNKAEKDSEIRDLEEASIEDLLFENNPEDMGVEDQTNVDQSEEFTDNDNAVNDDDKQIGESFDSLFEGDECDDCDVDGTEIAADMTTASKDEDEVDPENCKESFESIFEEENKSSSNESSIFEGFDSLLESDDDEDDALIDAAEDDTELSDTEAEELADGDDDLIDNLLGDDEEV